MDSLKELARSKKFLVFIGGIALVLIAKYVLNDDATALKVTGLIIAYLFSQGIADSGKEAAKIVAANPKPPEQVNIQQNVASPENQ